MNEISLCVIVKNEAHYLSGCLESAKNIADEIIVVDTGSTDNSKEIALSYNAEVYDFTWVNDFSAARNFSLSKATKDWILYLDADERLTEKSIEQINKIKIQKRKAGYYCRVVSPSAATGNPSVMKYIRFFRNLDNPRFEGKVHEQIIPDLKAKGFELIDSEIEILHIGYDVGKEVLEEKARRNLKLLLNDYNENPSSYNAFQLGQSYIFLNEFEKADEYFRLVAKREELDDEHLAQTYRYLAAFALSQKKLEDAENYALEGLRRRSESPLLNVVMANIKLDKGEFEAAADYGRKAYDYNSLYLSGEKPTGFEVLVDAKNMFLYGINLAIAAASVTLFNYLYPKRNKFDISGEEKAILKFYDEVFNSNEISAETIENALRYSDKINFEILYRILKNASEDKQIMVFKNFADKNHGSYNFNFAVAELFEEDNYDEAIYYYERAFEVKPNDLVVILKLLGLFSAKGDLNGIKRMLEKALPYFEDNPELHNRFLSIYNKL